MDEVAARIANVPALKQKKPSRPHRRPDSKTTKRINCPNYDPPNYRPSFCR
jgi:hypothetical protein